MRDEVMAAAGVLSKGAAPGSKPFFAVWTAAVQLVADSLSAEERERYENQAEEWTIDKPPADVQAKWVAQSRTMSLHSQ